MPEQLLPRSRKEFLRRLYESEAYKRAIAGARNEVERRRIAATVTELVTAAADLLVPAIDRVQRDPAFAEQLGRAVVEKLPVVTSNGPAASGSNGWDDGQQH